MKMSRCTTVLLPLILAACGGGGVGSSSDTNRLPPEEFFAKVVSQPFGNSQQDCGEQYASARGMPGDLIKITSIPSNMVDHATLRVISTEENGDPAYGLSLLRNVPGEENTLEFAVPINPNGNLDGGTVELELGDGERYCQRYTFVIQALPEANPEAATELANTLSNWLDEVITIYGQDPATLRNTSLKDLDTKLYLLKLYQIMFESGDDAIIPMLRRAASDEDLTVERLLTATNLQTAYAEQISQLRALPPMSFSEQAQPATQTRKLRSGSASCEVNLPSLSYNFSGAEDIAPVMRFANSQAVANEVFGLANTAAGSIGMIPHPAIKAAANIVGAAGLVMQTSYGIVTDLLPSNWGTVTFVVNPKRWQEDRPNTLVGRVSNVEAEAFSRSHNFSKDVVNHAFAAATILGGPAIGKRLPAGKVNGVPVADDLLGGFTLAIQDTVNVVIEDTADLFTVCVTEQSFGVIDLDDERWTRADINGSAIVWASQPDWEFIGKRLGDAEIEMTIRKSEFGASGTGTQSVSTIRADVVADVGSINVKEPGEIIRVEASRPDGGYAKDQIGIEVIPASAATLQNTEYVNNEWVVFTLETTTESEQYPFDLRLYPTGPMLEPQDNSRDERVEVRNEGSLEIDYQDDCVEPSEEVVFTATLDGFAEDEQSVVWDVYGATVVDSGKLSITVRAPANPGSFTVGAVATANSKVEDELEVIVPPSCLRKILYPLASFTTDGNGYYGTSSPDDPNPVCPTGDHDDMQSEALITDESEITALPDTPPASRLWMDRQASLSSNLQHQSTRYHKLGEQPNESCRSYSFQASSTGSAAFVGTPEGELSVSLNADLQADCKEIQDDDGNYVECAQAAANTGVNGFYYLEVADAPATFRLHGSLQCSNLDGYIILQPVTATISRYREGQQVVHTEEEPTGVRDEEGAPRSPQLVDVVCSSPNELIIIDETFTLAAAEQGYTDTVAISLLGNFLIMPGILQKEGYGLPDPSQAPPPQEGSYSGGGRIELQLLLEAQ